MAIYQVSARETDFRAVRLSVPGVVCFWLLTIECPHETWWREELREARCNENDPLGHDLVSIFAHRSAIRYGTRRAVGFDYFGKDRALSANHGSSGNFHAQERDESDIAAKFVGPGRICRELGWVPGG